MCERTHAAIPTQSPHRHNIALFALHILTVLACASWVEDTIAIPCDELYRCFVYCAMQPFRPDKSDSMHCNCDRNVLQAVGQRHGGR